LGFVESTTVEVGTVLRGERKLSENLSDFVIALCLS
jgi:hypothetical protein